MLVNNVVCHLMYCLLQLEKKHDILTGNSAQDFKRRNAVTNALIDLLGEKSGGHPLLARECLYAIAPPELWQFYSAQGLSGSCKSSFYCKMPHLYKAVLVAVVTRTGKEKSSVVSAISEVLKTVHNRAGPYKYRKEHPEEVLRHTLGHKDDDGNVVVDFAKKSVKGNKTPATHTTSAAAVESADTCNTSPAPVSDAQRDDSGSRRNPNRSVRPCSLPDVQGYDEEQYEYRHHVSDDSDRDLDYSPPKRPPVVKGLFRHMM